MNDVANPELVTVPAVRTAVVRGTVAPEQLRDFFDSSFRALSRSLAAQKVGIFGPAFGLFHGPGGAVVELEVGFPVDGEVHPDGDVVPGELPGGTLARVTHVGGFDGLAASWDRLHEWLQARGLSPSEIRWESYVTRPAPDTDPGTLRTELWWPVTGPDAI